MSKTLVSTISNKPEKLFQTSESITILTKLFVRMFSLPLVQACSHNAVHPRGSSL